MTVHKSNQLWKCKRPPHISPKRWQNRLAYFRDWVKRVAVFHYQFIQAVVKELQRVFYEGHSISGLLEGSEGTVPFSSNSRLEILDAYAAYVFSDVPWSAYEPQELNIVIEVADIGMYR
jgi:hypothetical protein